MVSWPVRNERKAVDILMDEIVKAVVIGILTVVIATLKDSGEA